MVKAIPLFAAAAGLGFLGVTLLLAAVQAVECGSFILSREGQ